MAIPKKPRHVSATGKADRPDVQPLDPFLAQLLSPALARTPQVKSERPAELPRPGQRKPAKAKAKPPAKGATTEPAGFGEAPQRGFTVAPGAEVDPALAQALG
ncbi:excinuclease ABC subunit B, partial [Methylobacterium sp. WL93]